MWRNARRSHFSFAVQLEYKLYIKWTDWQANGFQLTPETKPLTALCFADDIVIIGRDQQIASFLVTSAIQQLQEIGLQVNTEKSNAIIIKNGRLEHDQIFTVDGTITSIGPDDEIKYLGTTFKQTLIFNENKILEQLKNNLNKLITTHLLLPQQKLVTLHQFIGQL